MLTLIIIGLVIVIPLLFLVSFGWAPQPDAKKSPLEKRTESTLGEKSTDEDIDDLPRQ